MDLPPSVLAASARRSLTTWPVVVEIVSIGAGIDFMRQAMAEYGNLACDFADASLVYAATARARHQVLSNLRTRFFARSLLGIRQISTYC